MGELVELATKLWGGVAPVGRPTNPNLACMLGILLGGIGLAVYFRSMVDFLVPVAITLICLMTAGDGGMGWLFGAFIAGAYGYFRSAESNLRIAAAPAA